MSPCRMGLSGLCRQCPKSGRQPIRPARRKTITPCKAAWPLTLEIFSEGGALPEIEFLRLARTNLIVVPTGRASRAANSEATLLAPAFALQHSHLSYGSPRRKRRER